MMSAECPVPSGRRKKRSEVITFLPVFWFWFSSQFFVFLKVRENPSSQHVAVIRAGEYQSQEVFLGSFLD